MAEVLQCRPSREKRSWHDTNPLQQQFRPMSTAAAIIISATPALQQEKSQICKMIHIIFKIRQRKWMNCCNLVHQKKVLKTKLILSRFQCSSLNREPSMDLFPQSSSTRLNESDLHLTCCELFSIHPHFHCFRDALTHSYYFGKSWFMKREDTY